MNIFIGFLAAILAGGAVTLALPLVVRIAMAIRAMDYPGGRRVHVQATPRLGGIAIAIGIAAGAIYPMLVMWRAWGDEITVEQMVALFIGCAIVFLIGIADDALALSPLLRLLFQTLGASIVVYAGWSFSSVFVPFWGNVPLWLFSQLLTIAWIVGVTNAINLLDGLDGLAGGVVAIIASSMLIFAFIQMNTLMIIITAAVVGACLAFLRHNWAPARIYMGDSGSLTLGFILAVMSVHASIKQAATVAILVPLLALGLPVIDTVSVMLVRFAKKSDGSPVRRFARMFQADRNHLHHLMAHVAPQRQRIVVVIYLVAAWFCAMAVVVSISRSAALGGVLVLVEIAAVFVMRTMGARREARTTAHQEQLQHRQAEDVAEDIFADRTFVP